MIIDFTEYKQLDNPIAQRFSECMDRMIEDEALKANVDSMSAEIVRSFGASEDGALMLTVKGFVLALICQAQDMTD